MANGIIETGNLKGTISGSPPLTGSVAQTHTFKGSLGIPEVIKEVYTAGNGIVIENKVISLDSLIIDCGVGTTE